MAAVQPYTSIERISKAETTLPVEVLEFLERGGVTLLLKGESGTGKTTFALELLRFFGSGDDGCRGVYVTTRVGREELIELYPWVEEITCPRCVIDATKPHYPESKVDLAAPDVYYQLPEPLKHVYDVIRELPPTGLVVFDSWDALADHFEASQKPYEARTWSRRELESHLLDIFMHKGVNVVLVVESSGPTPLDYAADGVIELEMRYPLRLIREMIIHKLRGISIRQPRYLFTLHDGRFRSFKAIEPIPILLNIPEHPQMPPPCEDPSTDSVSSGICDLDDLMELGFKKGSVNLFEVGREVGGYCQVLMLPMIINALNLGRGVVMVPSICTSPKLLSENLAYWVSPENMGHLYVFRRMKSATDVWPQLEPPESDLLRQKFREYTRKRIEYMNMGTTFSFVGLDSIEMWYGHVDAFKSNIGLQADFIRDLEQVDVWIAREPQRDVIDVVASLANTYLKLDMEDSVLTVQGITPPTNIYAMEFSIGEGFPHVELTPIS